MRDEYRVLTGAAVGAVAGGLGAFLILTPRGRWLRRQVTPVLEEVTALLVECRQAMRRAQEVSDEARGVAADVESLRAGESLVASQ